MNKHKQRIAYYEMKASYEKNIGGKIKEMNAVLYGKERNTKGITLNGLIREQAEKYPEKTALKCQHRTLSYSEMERRIAALAAILREMGVKEETLVGIYMDRSEEMIISMMAIWEAGGAYVPLDPSHPKDRNRYIIEQSHIEVILSEEKYRDVFTDGCHVICLDAIKSFLDKGADPAPSRPAVPGKLAYVIFTSGSTGKPKGVMVEEEGMVNYLQSVSDRLELDADTIGMAVVTITFDISISELFLPLMNGGTLVVADQETARDGSLLVKLIRDEKIDLCGFTPSTAYMLLDSGLDHADGMRMLIGGEPWSITLAGDLLSHGVTNLWNVYGPTETTIYSAMTRITIRDNAISIGQPIEQTDLYVLNDQGQPVSDGEEGLLFIGGIGVARGYFENETLTRERFIPNPFDASRGRIYNTGDIVRFQGGEIFYVGRSDFQVKVHGYRIELGEIESALVKHPGVEQAVAVVIGEEKDARIHAFLKAKAGVTLQPQDIKETAEELLPYYMVPGKFTILEEYPMTANLKVDRKALMAMGAETESSDEYIAPTNEIEEAVAEIWKDLLGLERVSIRDDFLELGGHSLLANRLVNRINKAFETTITLVEFFSRPMTVEEMALMVEENLLAGLSEEELAALMQEEETGTLA